MTVLRGRTAVSFWGRRKKQQQDCGLCKVPQDQTVRDQERIVAQYVFSGHSPAPQLPALSTRRKTRREEEAWREGKAVGGLEEEKQLGSEIDGACASRRFKCEFQVIFYAIIIASN